MLILKGKVSSSKPNRAVVIVKYRNQTSPTELNTTEPYSWASYQFAGPNYKQSQSKGLNWAEDEKIRDWNER